MSEPQPIATRIPSVMEDPRAEAVARIYADAFLGAAGEDAAGLLEEFASFVTDVLNRNPEFQAFLTSGMVSRDDKLAFIDRVLTSRGSTRFVDFLRVLAKHDRLDLIPTILKESQHHYELQLGRRRVLVRSAKPLSEAAKRNIEQRLTASLPFVPILELQTDPSLLGGLVIRVEDDVFDGSLRSRMKQLRNRLRTRSLHEVQSGRDRFSHS